MSHSVRGSISMIMRLSDSRHLQLSSLTRHQDSLTLSSGCHLTEGEAWRTQALHRHGCQLTHHTGDHSWAIATGRSWSLIEAMTECLLAQKDCRHNRHAKRARTPGKYRLPPALRGRRLSAASSPASASSKLVGFETTSAWSDIGMRTCASVPTDAGADAYLVCHQQKEATILDKKRVEVVVAEQRGELMLGELKSQLRNTMGGELACVGLRHNKTCTENVTKIIMETR